MNPTPKLLADWCTLLMNGYQATAAEYRRDPSALNQQCLNAEVALLQNIADTVPVLLPEVWPKLLLVAPGALWHVDPQFDWNAAEVELRIIQAAARAAEWEDDEAQVNHSDDFHSLRWFGKEYTFSDQQAAVVKILYEHWKRGTPEVGGVYLSEAAECGRITDLFKKHPAWKTVVDSGTSKGNYRLREPSK